MTVEDIMEEVYELAGEPSDLDPVDAVSGDYDITETGAIRMLRAINRGMEKVSQHIMRRGGRRFRWRGQVKTTYLTATVLNGTTDDTSTVSIVDLDASHDGTDDGYRNYVLDIDDETRLVIDSDATTVTVGRALSSAPASGTDYTLCPRYVTAPTARFLEISKMYDLENQTILDRNSREDAFIGTLDSNGDPAQYRLVGDTIYFDVAPDDTRTFMVEYYAMPTLLTALTDVPEIPENFHWAIVLWATAWALGRQADHEGKYSFLQQFRDYMDETQTQYDLQFNHDKTQASYEGGY